MRIHIHTNLIRLRGTGKRLFDFCQVQDWNEKYGEVKKSKKGKKNAGSHMSLYIWLTNWKCNNLIEQMEKGIWLD